MDTCISILTFIRVILDVQNQEQLMFVKSYTLKTSGQDNLKLIYLYNNNLYEQQKKKDNAFDQEINNIYFLMKQNHNYGTDENIQM